jgi:hypothetical protein
MADSSQGNPGLSRSQDRLSHPIYTRDMTEAAITVDDERAASVTHHAWLCARIDLPIQQLVNVSGNRSGPMRIDATSVSVKDNVRHQCRVICRDARLREQFFDEPMQSTGIDAPLRLHTRIPVHLNSLGRQAARRDRSTGQQLHATRLGIHRQQAY